MSTMESSFDGLTNVGEQVPSIGDLQRPGCAEADASGILGRAVPGDDPDVRPPFEPAGQRRRAAVRQEVDHAMAILVHHEIVPQWQPFLVAQSSTPMWTGDGASRIGMALMSRSTVARLAGILKGLSKRAPPAPPQAMPTRPCASASRRVRRARGLRNSDGGSAKVRRSQDGLQQ